MKHLLAVLLLLFLNLPLVNSLTPLTVTVATDKAQYSSISDTIITVEIYGKVSDNTHTHFYDQAGKVIYVDSTYTSPTDIPLGQAYGFKITDLSALC